MGKPKTLTGCVDFVTSDRQIESITVLNICICGIYYYVEYEMEDS